MTRKSERELERAVDDLGGDVDTPHEWVDRYLERTLGEHGFDVEYPPFNNEGDAGGPSETERVPVKESGNYVFLAPRSDVPDWIDREDLPVDA